MNMCSLGMEMEQVIVSEVTAEEQAKMSLIGTPDEPGVAAKIFRLTEEASVNVDIIVQNSGREGKADISFTFSPGDLVAVQRMVGCIHENVHPEEIRIAPRVVKISLLGIGVGGHAGIASQILSVFAKLEIDIIMMSSSSLKLSYVIASERAEEATAALREEFGL